MNGDVEQSDIKIKFGGEPNELNVNTLLKSLASLTTVIDEINVQIGGGQKLEIRVRALEKGSFLIHLGLMPMEVLEMIKANWETVSKVIATLVNLLNLRKLLRGEKPEKIEEKGNDLIIPSKSGSTVLVDKRTFNIYNSNVRINEALSENFEALKADSSIESFEVQDVEERTLFESPRTEFSDMAVWGQLEIPQENIKIINELATLNIFKLVWDKTRKWEFYYHGNKISAIISDDSFFKMIDKGEAFAKGDSLEVELQFKQKFDTSVNTHITILDSYQVTRVIKHVARPKQEKFDFPA
jgi:hypothetical protein